MQNYFWQPFRMKQARKLPILLSINSSVNIFGLCYTKGEFHKSWAHGVKLKVHPNLGENAISWV
jgi:hypothetical protein